MPPSDQCTDEIEASASGAAPGRSIAAMSAAVQSPSGRAHGLDREAAAGARVIHSSTAEE